MLDFFRLLFLVHLFQRHFLLVVRGLQELVSDDRVVVDQVYNRFFRGFDYL